MTGVDDYELESQIGSGASGTVWRAHRKGPVPQPVALKRLRASASSPEDLARMRREAMVLTELDHPHIVGVVDVFEDEDEGLALAMQLAPGGSLDALLAERGRLAPGEVAAVAAPLADALASAHRRGIAHGDVKPANILFTRDGEPLLTDFGVARTLGQHTSDTVTGTAAYLAPELLEGAVPDVRADVYSLAVVCYEMLAGKLPFEGATPMAVMHAAGTGTHERLTDLPGIPGELAETVERAMMRDPGQRIASANEFAAALRGAVPPPEFRLPGTPSQAMAGSDDAALATDAFGPRPSRPAKPAEQIRRRLPVMLFVGLGAAALLLLVRGPLSSDDDSGDDGDDGEPFIPAADDDCPEVQDEPTTAPGEHIVIGDPEGDGCDTYGLYGAREIQGRVLAILTIPVNGEQLDLSMGEPTTQVFLGDWFCEGADMPGAYSPERGAIEYYEAWPTEDEPNPEPRVTESAPPGAVATVEEIKDDDTRCAEIVVAADT